LAQNRTKPRRVTSRLRGIIADHRKRSVGATFQLGAMFGVGRGKWLIARTSSQKCQNRTSDTLEAGLFLRLVDL
jgi:hypothetical protein